MNILRVLQVLGRWCVTGTVAGVVLYLLLTDSFYSWRVRTLGEVGQYSPTPGATRLLESDVKRTTFSKN